MKGLNQRQIEFLLTPEFGRFTLCCGSVRSGKTYGLYFLILYLANTMPGKGVLVAKTLETLRENVLDPLKSIAPDSVSYKDSGRQILISGHEVRGVGCNDEQSKNKIHGGTLWWAVGDEVALWPKTFLQMLLTRLSTPGAKLYGSCNPEGTQHWLKKEYIDKGLVQYHHFKLSDNPTLPPEYVAALERENTGVYYERYILGKWVDAEGQIYNIPEELFDPECSKRKYRRYIVGMDYGTTNPMVFLLIGYNTPQDIAVVKEYYYDSNATGQQLTKTDTQYADDYEAWAKEAGVHIDAIYLDPSAASFRAELYCRRLPVIQADNDVENGIKYVMGLFGNRYLRISPECVNTCREHKGYAWDPEAQARGEDKPLKADDHSPDALRYGAYTGIRNIAPIADYETVDSRHSRGPL